MWTTYVNPGRRISTSFECLVYSILVIMDLVMGGSDLWPLERPEGMPSIQSLEVMCGKDHMDVHLTFSQPFEGIVSSKGQHGDPRCVYVPPSTGQTFFSFRIAYSRCGTKPDLNGQFYENTVVVQYDKDLLEVWDEAKRLRCEWFNDYEKTASKPPMVIADLDVIQLDFRGDNVDCWMEIQHGKGPWAPPVSGIVPLGSTLTLVVAINDYRGEFDMRVKSCIASDGAGHVIQLSDEFGCVLRPKMISRFLKARGADDRASVITYAFFHAFKFPDALSVHIKCKVEICRHGCLEHCQLQQQQQAHQTGGPELNLDLYDSVDRKDVTEKKHVYTLGSRPYPDAVDDNDSSDDYDDIVQEGEGGAAIEADFPPDKGQLNSGEDIKSTNDMESIEDEENETTDSKKDPPEKSPFVLSHETFPYGPRQLKEDNVQVIPAHIKKLSDKGLVAEPRSISMAENHDQNKTSSSNQFHNNTSDSPIPERLKRRKRTIVVSNRKTRSASVGVSGLYEVISEADLAFSPDTRAEAVTVFQGRIREEVVYGICMPMPGFSLLFVLVAVSAVVSALVAGSLLYRYQLQKERMVNAETHNTALAMSTFANWVRLKLPKGRYNESNSNHQHCNGSAEGSMVCSADSSSISSNREARDH
ncbi:uncharacterized protein LOC112906704 [Agrilus planipennis]|uniref:Uncharacterized protein LOC112906704 n=1 Tax=Agrilus planipennis TaxID=224129 RepID=A0A7F5RMB8_AGRPL|nr:uncharacterized protein LOC112906704 [Agrilus planipennis]XP_025837167.1 uncharacterized protein LOC112906704 [Agrilus planipennis]XP_025837168.1 uncharacterized protein LOC112906704 [Agrilus planipennis]